VSEKIIVAAVQMVSTPEPAENMRTVTRLVREAADAGASLVLLPEYWPLLGRTDQDKLHHAETPGTGLLQDFMASTARDAGVWLLGGTVPLVSGVPGKVLNTLLAYDPEGQQRARYDKIHLFGFNRGDESFDESRTIVPGSQVCAGDTLCAYRSVDLLRLAIP
jgi:nitrilase